jgi:hypothetical protein
MAATRHELMLLIHEADGCVGERLADCYTSVSTISSLLSYVASTELKDEYDKATYIYRRSPQP